MAVLIRCGEMIEASKCDIYTRKILWKGLHKDPITKKNMTLYELDRNCSAEITEEIVLDEEEKKLREKLNVHLSLDDKIKGDAIQLYVESIRKDLKIEVKEGQTSTHGANLAHTNVRTIGSIKYPFSVFNNILGFAAKSKPLKNK